MIKDLACVGITSLVGLLHMVVDLGPLPFTRVPALSWSFHLSLQRSLSPGRSYRKRFNGEDLLSERTGDKPKPVSSGQEAYVKSGFCNFQRAGVSIAIHV